jgi:hypothetical protein
MPVIFRNPDIPTVTRVPNILAGSAFEIAPQRGVISMGIMQETGGMSSMFSAGSDIIVEDFQPPIGTTFPVIPDQMYFSDVVEVLDRLVIPVFNPTGGALMVWCVVQITPLAR